MNALLVQPGAYGDIFVCAPIAKWYADLGYTVYWPVDAKFKETLEYFSDYVTVGSIPSSPSLDPDWLKSDVKKILSHGKWDKIINLADRGPHATAQRHDENFEQCKYRLAGVPFEEKNKLVWKRDKVKEAKLFSELGLNPDDTYAVFHKKDSRNEEAYVPQIGIKTIEVEPIEGYNIPDWYLVFKHATEIYCIESSVHQFLDGIVDELIDKRYLLKRPAVASGCRFTVSTNWDLTYIGIGSRVKG